MGSLFSKPSPPPAPAPIVTDDTESVKEAARAEAERMRKRRGMKSTILTGPGGVMDTASILKTTLG